MFLGMKWVSYEWNFKIWNIGWKEDEQTNPS